MVTGRLPASQPAAPHSPPLHPPTHHHHTCLPAPAPAPAPPAETTQQRIEEAFREFTNREDVAVLLINQVIAGMIRHLMDAYTKPVPAILEIPSKDAPYDPSQDSVLQRVRFMFGES